MDDYGSNEAYLQGKTIISWTGTRHLIGPPFKEHNAGRISSWCGFGIHPEDALAEAVRDCEFCKKALASAKATGRKEVERIRVEHKVVAG